MYSRRGTQTLCIIKDEKSIPMNFVIVKPKISQEEFIQHLIELFPVLEYELKDEDYQGLIHLQVACLTRYANHCLSTGRLDELKRIFDFFQETVEKVDSATENALYVSFLEHLEMDMDNKHGEEAKQLLKPEYMKVWNELRK
jgi:hypothetical protein